VQGDSGDYMMNSTDFLSEFLVKNLTGSVTGDDGHFPYRKGADIILLFNRFGFKDTYPESMEGSRRIYTNAKIRQLQSFEDLRKLIDIICDPKEFFSLPISIEDAVAYMNDYLKLDSYEVRFDGNSYKLFSANIKTVEHSATSTLSHDFIIEQIDKCEEKLSGGDYDGAITNARSLIEAVSISLIEKATEQKYNSNGDLTQIFKDVKNSLNMNIDKEKYPDYLIQIISGMTTIINGMAALTNRASDRHARVYKPQKHHAKFAVNCAFSFCDFIVDSYFFQNSKGKAV
jgi:hypothetical protein